MFKPNRRFSTALRDPVRREIEAIERADIMVGIPSYNNMDTIAHVIETVAKGIKLYYPGMRAVIFVSDGGSTDDTREMARDVDTQVYGVCKLVSIYRGVPGKGSAVRAIFEAAKFLQVEALALFDADLRSIKPEWVKSVLSPVFEGYDFVAPDYLRYKYDATITNTIAYNLTRALYGKRIRQPIGGDFGVSRNLLRAYLEEDVWESAVAKFGIDIWMTTTAVVNGFKICQARLGAKVHDEKDPAQDLSPMFRQVVGTMFMLMEEHEDFWRKIKGSEPVPTFGSYPSEKPEPFEIDIDALIDYFKIGFNNFNGIWEDLLEKEDFEVIKGLLEKSASEFFMPIETWVRIVYRYAASFHKTPRQKFKLLNTMIPLYNARVASMVNELDGKNDEEAEAYFDKQAEKFEQMKPYLLEVWGR